ncbi:MAG TPA: hypothetical protein VIH82_09185 [Acidimicrobiia bacterium]|jgi:hypothetical protein
MAIAVVFEFPTDSVAKYDEVLKSEPATRTQPARSHHVCFETDGGFTVVDVWDSPEAFEAFGAVLGPAIEKAGLAAEPKVYPVHNTM